MAALKFEKICLPTLDTLRNFFPGLNSDAKSARRALSDKSDQWMRRGAALTSDALPSSLASCTLDYSGRCTLAVTASYRDLRAPGCGSAARRGQ